jgi:hypothetical protein
MPKQTVRAAAWVRPALGALGAACGLFLATAASRAQAEHPDAHAPGYLFCPECGTQMAWGNEAPKKPLFCPNCKPNKKVLMQFTAQRPRGPSTPDEGLFSGLLGKVMIGLVVFLCVGCLVLWRARARREAQLSEPRWLFHCPTCHREIEYRQSLAGARDLCSFCKGHFVYPDPDKTPDKDHRSRKTVKKWSHKMAKLPRRKKAPP